MNKYITVSTKVKKDLKEEAEKLGINISEVLRKALEEGVKKRKLEMPRDRLKELSNTLEKIDIDRIIESIREDREGK